MRIIVNDYVYVEYGLEKEVINKAIEDYNVHDDPNFKVIIDSLEELHDLNHSFLNI